MAQDHILIVDDEEAIREVVSTLLEAQGYRCTAVGQRPRSGMEYLQNNSVESGSERHDDAGDERHAAPGLAARTRPQDFPVIMVTAMHDVSTALEAIRRGAYDYILKPFEKDQLFLSVRRALEHRRLLLENRNYQRNLEKLVEQRTARAAARAAASSSSPTTRPWRRWAARWT